MFSFYFRDRKLHIILYKVFVLYNVQQKKIKIFPSLHVNDLIFLWYYGITLKSIYYSNISHKAIKTEQYNFILK